MPNQIFVDGHGLCEVWDLPRVAPKKQRRGKYVSESFVHPAKMSVPLCRKIIKTYTKQGEFVLDPMTGISTTLIEAAYLGRNSVGVELEEKFVKLSEQNIGLLEKVQTLTPKGRAQVVKGDARELSKILREKADVAVFSPPYVSTTSFRDTKFMKHTAHDQAEKAKKGETRGHYATPEARIRQFEKAERGKIENPNNIANLPYGKPVDAIVTSPPYSESIGTKGGGDGIHFKQHIGISCREARHYSKSKENIGNLSHGQIDAIVSSPPYSESMSKKRKGYTTHSELSKTRHMGLESSDDNIGNLKHGQVDSVIFSPPYEATVGEGGHHRTCGLKAVNEANKRFEVGTKEWRDYVSKLEQARVKDEYSKNVRNIGNLKKETYLSAMLAVYRECLGVLKPGGKMALVIKDFIRNKKVVRLDLDTRRLCEAAGFRWVETKLFRLPSKSFWRILYEKKYPEVDTSLLQYEFVEVFEKPETKEGGNH